MNPAIFRDQFSLSPSSRLDFNVSKFALFCLMALISYFRLNNCILLVSSTVNHLESLLQVNDPGPRCPAALEAVCRNSQPGAGLGLGSAGECERVLSSPPKQEFPGGVCKDVGIGKGKYRRSRGQSGGITAPRSGRGPCCPRIGCGFGAGHSLSLGFSFLICEMWIITHPLQTWREESMK